MRNDFDKRWAAMERTGSRMHIFAMIWIAFVLTLVLGGVGLTIYALFNPEIIGAFVGRIVRGFDAA